MIAPRRYLRRTLRVVHGPVILGLSLSLSVPILLRSGIGPEQILKVGRNGIPLALLRRGLRGSLRVLLRAGPVLLRSGIGPEQILEVLRYRLPCGLRLLRRRLSGLSRLRLMLQIGVIVGLMLPVGLIVLPVALISGSTPFSSKSRIVFFSPVS